MYDQIKQVLLQTKWVFMHATVGCLHATVGCLHATVGPWVIVGPHALMQVLH